MERGILTTGTTFTRCDHCPFRFPVNRAEEHRPLCEQIRGYELKRGKKELHAAAERGHDGVVAFILTQKFLDVNAVDKGQDSICVMYLSGVLLGVVSQEQG